MIRTTAVIAEVCHRALLLSRPSCLLARRVQSAVTPTRPIEPYAIGMAVLWRSL
jgi:hypothetical protein